MTTEERLERVERELATVKRRNRWILGSAGLLMAGCLTMAAALGDQQTIRAKEFVLADEDGKDRATLRVCPGGAVLQLNDANSNPRIGLSVREARPELDLYDDNGKIRAFLSLFGGNPSLDLSDEKTSARLRLNVTETGPVINFFGPDGNTRIMMSVDSTNGPVMLMHDEKENIRFKAP